MRKTLLPLALLALAPLGGCVLATAAAGAAYGYIKYENNEAVADLEARPDQVWSAALDALEARSYALPTGAARSIGPETDRAEVDGDGYWLRVEQQPGDVTRVRVRIGMFETEENERQAALLIESIRERL